MILEFAFSLALASGPAGQAAPPKAPPEVARAEGDRIIAAANAGDVFENISQDGTTRLRHKASGMVCGFEPLAPGNNVHVYPQSPITPQRGDDVSCGNTAGAAYTRYATRYRPMPTTEQDMAGAVAGVRRNWTQVEPLEGAFAVAAGEGRPDPVFAAFKGRHPNGTDAATFIVITHVDGWSFKVRASGLPADAASIASMASLLASGMLPPIRED